MNMKRKILPFALISILAFLWSFSISNALLCLPVNQGGTGVCTITGIPYGTGTANLSTVTIGSGLSFSGGTLSASGGSGTVTSVTFTGDGTVLSSTPSSAVTTSGTLTAALKTQTANKVLAGPTSGGAANPTFRSLVSGDIPSLSGTYLTIANNLSDLSNQTTAQTNLIASVYVSNNTMLYYGGAGVGIKSDSSISTDQSGGLSTTSLTTGTTNSTIYTGGSGGSTFNGTITQNSAYAKFGNAAPFLPVTTGVDVWGNDNTTNGVQIGVGNRSSGIHAYSDFFLNNNLASDGLVDHYFAISLNSSTYSDTTFGTGLAIANQTSIQNTDGPITSVASSNSSAGYFNWLARGTSTTNEVFRIDNTGASVGLTGTLTGAIKFAGATSTSITLQGQAVGSSGVLTLPAATDTLVGKATTDTLTNKRITKRVVTASDTTSITPNTDNADITYQSNSQATGTLTINNDTGTCTNGQSWALKEKSTNVETFAWGNGYVGGTTALPTVTTGGGKIDYWTFICDTVNSKWDFTGQALGF